MTEPDDIELVSEYARSNSQEAFTALVARHVNLVYSVALRRTSNSHAAEEITQAVFLILAKKAGRMSPRTILSGWLYQTARLTAANYLRTEMRRAQREQEAYMQSLSHEPAPDFWPQIAPHLEDAMGRLGDQDRNAIVLRYIEGKNLREVGAALGASEDAAKMRVNRALEKLRKFFTKRGVLLTAAVIAGAVSANSVQAAPGALSTTIAATAIKGSAVAASTLTLIKGTLKLMAWTKAKTAVVVSVVTLLTAGTGVVAVKTFHSYQAAHWPDIQGAWVGDFEFGQLKMPVLYKFSRTNGSYAVVMDHYYQGFRELPVSTFTYKYPSVRIEQASLGFVYEGVVDPKTMEVTGTWKQRGASGLLTLKLNNNQEVFPPSLTEDDYAPVTGSAQGQWLGTLKVGEVSMRVVFKIAALPGGNYRAELDSLDQGAKGVAATSASYSQPAIKLEFGGIQAAFAGTLERGAIQGTWTQAGKSFPLTLQRAGAPGAVAAEAGDYAFVSKTELQGHWKGTLEIKQVKARLRLALDIARLPNNIFSATMISLDQGAQIIPANAISYSAPVLHVEWKALGAAYDAKLVDGKLVGAWNQMGGKLPLVMERDKKE